MNTPTPTSQRNPYLSTLGTLAGLALIVGLALVTAAMSNSTGTALTLATIGGWLLAVGVLLGTTWLAVQALLWRPNR
ncbi:hypothetical protein BAY59_07560 [Prauserella coralliicola]|nr:hypothetical protein BAY59_07560 [Prauserella coralliicola]